MNLATSFEELDRKMRLGTQFTFPCHIRYTCLIQHLTPPSVVTAAPRCVTSLIRRAEGPVVPMCTYGEIPLYRYFQTTHYTQLVLLRPRRYLCNEEVYFRPNSPSCVLNPGPYSLPSPKRFISNVTLPLPRVQAASLCTIHD